ncbi:hypothetical protein TSUD_415270 [Trifolium subterraneum]|uniref:Retrotransposon gag domain-containing protein n=1 Tax=Trifolium subterraneum TaxID=3900 RepID=A0A2Z6P5P3_TRISU|nr:hypothetical protein TSUD_415270 [Trifolium subterraneum]
MVILDGEGILVSYIDGDMVPHVDMSRTYMKVTLDALGRFSGVRICFTCLGGVPDIVAKYSGTMTSARANAQIAESLATLTHLLARGDDPARDGEKRLDRFLKHKPSFFVGGFNPDGAEANQWWKNAKLRLGDRGVVITWDMFKREFFNKYFPEDVKNKKVVEFMKLEQGNMSVVEYAAKFESLCAFSPHYNTPEAENDKCVKFESGLRPDIKHIIGFAEIRNFTTLVAKARICDEDEKAKSNYFKAVRGRSQDRAKPYEPRKQSSNFCVPSLQREPAKASEGNLLMLASARQTALFRLTCVATARASEEMAKVARFFARTR